jgi:predicted benzoate:H+ symporter BenE
VAVAVLATTIRRFAQDSEALAAFRFSREAVILYGSYLSLITLIAYLPLHLTYTLAGRMLVQRLYPLEQIDSANIASYLEGRKALEEFLGLDLGSRSDMRAAAAVAAPFLTAVLSLLL